MLRIFVVSHNGSPPATPVSGVFGNGEGSIGRDETNTLALAEPDKHLSRIQAQIKCLGGEYFLLDVGGNPSIVNGRPVGKGKVATLHPGDKIRMAGWVLQVAPVAPVTTAGLPERRPLAADVASKALLQPAVANPSVASGNSAEIGTATVLMTGPFTQTAAGRSWGGPSDFLQEAMLAEPLPGRANAVSANSADRTDTATLQAALLRGLGITATADWQLDEQQAEQLGALLRASMDGFQRLLKEQALSRKVLQPAMEESVATAKRNPLKTSADAAIALHRMLFQAPAEDCLAPVEAIRDAVLELHAHHAGVSLGIRGAVAGMLTSFKPEVLEKRLAGANLAEGMERHLWDLYLKSHAEIARKAEDVFHSTLLQAYRRVYEDQKSRQSAGRTTSG